MKSLSWLVKNILLEIKEWWNSYTTNSSSCFFPSSFEEGIPATLQFSNGSSLEITMSEKGSFWGNVFVVVVYIVVEIEYVDAVVECVESKVSRDWGYAVDVVEYKVVEMKEVDIVVECAASKVSRVCSLHSEPK